MEVAGKVYNAYVSRSGKLTQGMGHTCLNPVLMSWSGGKDSCLALYEVQKSRDYRVAALLTTLTRDYDRVSMHGVRRVLLQRQAAALGIPLHEVFITKDATNQEYETKMAEAFSAYREDGVDSVVFGDLFLEEIRDYREQFLARHGMRGVYPVWRRDTTEFIREFIGLGFKAVITCVNGDVLNPSFAGMMIDEYFLSLLPPQSDFTQPHFRKREAIPRTACRAPCPPLS